MVFRPSIIIFVKKNSPHCDCSEKYVSNIAVFLYEIHVYRENANFYTKFRIKKTNSKNFEVGLSQTLKMCQMKGSLI